MNEWIFLMKWLKSNECRRGRNQKKKEVEILSQEEIALRYRWLGYTDNQNRNVLSLRVGSNETSSERN